MLFNYKKKPNNIFRTHYIIYARRFAKVRKNFEDTRNASELLEISAFENGAP